MRRYSVEWFDDDSESLLYVVDNLNGSIVEEFDGSEDAKAYDLLEKLNLEEMLRN